MNVWELTTKPNFIGMYGLHIQVETSCEFFLGPTCGRWICHSVDGVHLVADWQCLRTAIFGNLQPRRIDECGAQCRLRFARKVNKWGSAQSARSPVTLRCLTSGLSETARMCLRPRSQPSSKTRRKQHSRLFAHSCQWNFIGHTTTRSRNPRNPTRWTRQDVHGHGKDICTA